MRVKNTGAAKTRPRFMHRKIRSIQTQFNHKCLNVPWVCAPAATAGHHLPLQVSLTERRLPWSRSTHVHPSKEPWLMDQAVSLSLLRFHLHLRGFVRSHRGTSPSAQTQYVTATTGHLHPWSHRSSVPSVHGGRELHHGSELPKGSRQSEPSLTTKPHP